MVFIFMLGCSSSRRHETPSHRALISLGELYPLVPCLEAWKPPALATVAVSEDQPGEVSQEPLIPGIVEAWDGL